MLALKTFPDLSITINESQINYIQKKIIVPVINNSQNYHPYRKKTRGYSKNKLPELLKQALKENLLIAPINIPPNATIEQKLLLFLNKQNNKHILIYRYFHIGKTLYERKLELEATNITPKAIQKQIHNEFKTAAGPTNTYYKLRTASRLYNLFNTCENVLQNSILHPMKIQHIGKLTELKFQQFSDQITLIILDHYLDITDSAWTSTELNLKKKIMLLQININNIKKKRPKNLHNNKFKVATTPDTATLEYYQFNIPDGIEVVKKSVYQYIKNCINNYLFGNYNISEIRSNLYNNLVHYLQLGTEDLNSETLATYFQELNFNIIEYCEEKYSVQSKYSFDFKSETETSNKGKQKLKQYSKTALNTLILLKTTAKHLQTPEQGTSSKLSLTITSFPASLAQAETLNSPLNQFSRLEDYTSPKSSTRQQETLQTSTNLLDYLAENTSEYSETLANKENVSESIEEEIESKKESELTDNKEEDKMTAYIAKIPKFNEEDIETSPQEWFDQVTKAGDANEWNGARMLRTIPYFLKGTAGEWFENLITPFNDWTVFKTAFLEQFTDNNTSITLQNCFHNIKQEPSKSDKLIKKVCPHAPEDLNSAIQHAKRYKMAIEEANRTKLSKTISPTNNNSNPKDINHPKNKIKILSHHPLITSLRIAITLQRDQQNRSNQYYPPSQQSYYQPLRPAYYLPRPQYQNNYYQPVSQPIQQQYQQPPTQHYQNQFKQPIGSPKFCSTKTQPLPHSIQLFNNTRRTEFSPYCTLGRIAENANLSDIFSFEFEANESLFLLNNAAANKQKAITAMYTKAEVKEKAIRLILDSRSARSIITYQLMQQLKKNTVIVITNGMKKTSVEEIANFSFTFDEITIPVKVLIIKTGKPKNYNSSIKDNMPKYSLLVKAPVFEFEEKEEKHVVKTFMALESTSNWAEETKQTACISPKEEYENHTCYYCKAYHRERWDHLIKRSGKWDNTLCLTCGNTLPEECNWIDVAIKGGVFKRGTLFDAAYDSALNKLYYYPHNAEMIFNLAMTLVNRATKEDVCQIKEAEYIEYTLELAGYNYKDEVKVYHQITSHTYPTKEAQAQRLEQMNIKFENNKNEIEFEEPEATEKIETTPIYLIKNQSALQLKYFNNNGQGIKPEKAHEIDAGYELRYPKKNTFVLKLKSLTKINLKIALKIPPGTMV
ncbi:hypothetical protein G9A89_018355 [Geosiphon pyriformis]|nr:hypothetical protein G9A89_018355 [Geosiphon pyriformis]